MFTGDLRERQRQKERGRGWEEGRKEKKKGNEGMKERKMNKEKSVVMKMNCKSIRTLLGTKGEPSKYYPVGLLFKYISLKSLHNT